MIVLAFLLSLLFSDTVDCTVQGKVWHLNESEPVDFSPGNTCIGVRVTTDEKQVVMYSPNYWVTVQIPPEKGHRTFQYQWGKHLAHIGAETVPVTAWGHVGKG